MPKSESAKVAKLIRTTKGCLDILLSSYQFEDKFKETSYSVLQDIKRDLFLVGKTPQQSALLILSELITLRYPKPTMEIQELQVKLEKLSGHSIHDVLHDKSQERKEFNIRIRKFYEGNARRMQPSSMTGII